MKKTFYITTPIYYPSANLHIGHVYTTVIADVLAKYKKMQGYETFFLTGSDEHGQKIEIAAKNMQKKPKEYVDEIVKGFIELWKVFKIDYDHFIRTTDSEHIMVIKNVWNKLLRNNDIYFDKYEGFYCVHCEETFPRDEVRISEENLCPSCGRKLRLLNEESYFFNMKKYEKFIANKLSNDSNFINPVNRSKELLKNFINTKSGLLNLSISRSTFSWGIKVPNDEKHVIYVWIDALFNYLSALGYTTNEATLYKTFWENSNAEIVHVIGKEITRFHCIYWPIFLKSLNEKMPTKIISHGWITTDNEKMSKSKGNAIDPLLVIEKYAKYSPVDALRYYLLRSIDIGNDHNLSLDNFVAVYNSDLVNNYANFASRVHGMVKKYNAGEIGKYIGRTASVDDQILLKTAETIVDFEKAMDEYNIKNALISVQSLINFGNKLIEIIKPWELNAKKSSKILNSFLIHLVQIVRVYAKLLSPFLPEGTEKIREMFQFKDEQWNYATIDEIHLLSNLTLGKSRFIYVRNNLDN